MSAVDPLPSPRATPGVAPARTATGVPTGLPDASGVHYPLVEHRLDNGLRIVVNPDPTSPAVGLNIWYQVGSRDEDPGFTGFAHLFEHLMFQGSAQVASGDHLASMQAVGGSVNATTSFDRTNYFEAVPPHALDLALWLEADRMASLAVTRANLDNQRDVVLEEKRQRYDNAPYGDLLQLLLQLNFPEGHPYHHPTIGSMPDLMAAPLEAVQEFHRHWYQPANASLVVSGRVDADDAIERITRYFGALPSTAQPPRRPVPVLGAHSGRPDLTVTRDVPRTLVTLSWRVPNATDPRSAVVEQLTAVLGQGQSARLHERLVRGDRIAESVSASVLGLGQGDSLAMVTATVTPGADEARVVAAIEDEISRLAAEGPRPDELARACAQFERELLSDLASVDDRADHINEAASLLGDPQRVNTALAEIQAVDAEAVRRAASELLSPEAAATLHYRAQES